MSETGSERWAYPWVVRDGLPTGEGALALAFSGLVELRARRGARRARGIAVARPAVVARLLAPFIDGALEERFLALGLDGRHRALAAWLVSQGTATGSLVHPRECFRTAIALGCIAVVLAHNHPSGDAEPSGEDREVTERMAKAGELVGIRVVDHVILTDGGAFCSLRERGIGGLV